MQFWQHLEIVDFFQKELWTFVGQAVIIIRTLIYYNFKQCLKKIEIPIKLELNWQQTLWLWHTDFSWLCLQQSVPHVL